MVKISPQYKIYYFTGTGNSLYTARKLAELTKSTCHSIAEVLNQKEPITASHILIVFPSYLALIYGIPVIVKEFIERIPNISSKTIYAVCSCGGYEIVNALPSIACLKKIIKKQGGKLKEYFTLRLPMNNCDYDHIPIPIEKDVKLLTENAEHKIEQIAREIQNPRIFTVKKLKYLCYLLLKPLLFFLKKPGYLSMVKTAREPEKSSMTIEEIFHHTDRSISADSSCNGCGICVKVCPVNNILLIKNKPRWQHRCEMCFACHEWCPQKAIHHWGRKEGVYYHHPQVTLSDFLKRRDK